MLFINLIFECISLLLIVLIRLKKNCLCVFLLFILILFLTFNSLKIENEYQSIWNFFYISWYLFKFSSFLFFITLLVCIFILNNLKYIYIILTFFIINFKFLYSLLAKNILIYDYIFFAANSLPFSYLNISPGYFIFCSIPSGFTIKSSKSDLYMTFLFFSHNLEIFLPSM